MHPAQETANPIIGRDGNRVSLGLLELAAQLSSSVA
jgi:hypothetical protein